MSPGLELFGKQLRACFLTSIFNNQAWEHRGPLKALLGAVSKESRFLSERF